MRWHRGLPGSQALPDRAFRLPGAADAENGVGHGFESFVGDRGKAVGAGAVGAFVHALEGSAQVNEFFALPPLLGEIHLLGLHGFDSGESADGHVGGYGFGLGVILGEEGFDFLGTRFYDRTNRGKLGWGHNVELSANPS